MRIMLLGTVNFSNMPSFHSGQISTVEKQTGDSGSTGRIKLTFPFMNDSVFFIFYLDFDILY